MSQINYPPYRRRFLPLFLLGLAGVASLPLLLALIQPTLLLAAAGRAGGGHRAMAVLG